MFSSTTFSRATFSPTTFSPTTFSSIAPQLTKGGQFSIRCQAKLYSAFYRITSSTMFSSATFNLNLTMFASTTCSSTTFSSIAPQLTKGGQFSIRCQAKLYSAFHRITSSTMFSPTTFSSTMFSLIALQLTRGGQFSIRCQAKLYSAFHRITSSTMFSPTTFSSTTFSLIALQLTRGGQFSTRGQAMLDSAFFRIDTSMVLSSTALRRLTKETFVTGKHQAIRSAVHFPIPRYITPQRKLASTRPSSTVQGVKFY
ncbi:hypothetical protein PENSOL_c011G06648, partial [Penicillium solitum]